MEGLRSRTHDTDAWVPVRASQTVNNGYEYGKIGYREEYFGSIGLLFDTADKAGAMACEWTSVNGHSTTPWIRKDRFQRAGRFEASRSGVLGEFLVLRQHFEAPTTTEWYLDQDFELALGLSRTGDVWVRPAEGDRKVARLQRDGDGEPVLLEVRNEYLKDYLCACDAGLLLAQFHERIGIDSDGQAVSWSDDGEKEDLSNCHWEGRTQKILPSGFPAGGITVQQVSRTDVDYSEDVPCFDPNRENAFQTESSTVELTQDTRFRISGELWKNDWITSGNVSPRVRGDDVDMDLPFIVGADGSTARSDELGEALQWLWFRPTVVNALLDSPHGTLGWYTEDTGTVGSSGRNSVHFGVNDLGLVNVLARDVTDLPSSDQKIWAAHNCTPEGGVSKELLMAQMEAKPAKTTAPEIDFRTNLSDLESLSEVLFGTSLLRSHPKEDELLDSVNRFCAIDQEGVYQLAKEINRVVVERLNEKLLRKQISSAEEDLGSIKLLERFLNEAGADGYTITGALVGVYDLRQADAHLPSSDLSEELNLIGISDLSTPSLAGKAMMETVAETLSTIHETMSGISPEDVVPWSKGAGECL